MKTLDELFGDQLFIFHVMLLLIVFMTIRLLFIYILSTQDRANYYSLANAVEEKKALLTELTKNSFANIKFFVKVTRSTVAVSKTGAPWQQIYFFTWGDKELKVYASEGNVYEIFISEQEVEKMAHCIVSMSVNCKSLEIFLNEEIILHFTKQINAIDATFDHDSYILLPELVPGYMRDMVFK